MAYNAFLTRRQAVEPTPFSGGKSPIRPTSSKTPKAGSCRRLEIFLTVLVPSRVCEQQHSERFDADLVLSIAKESDYYSTDICTFP